MPRQKIVPYDDRIRDRINVGMIVTKLQAHIENPDKTPMLATQLNASRILLNKLVPDVKALEIKRVDNTSAQSIPNEQLRAIINGTSKRID